MVFPLLPAPHWHLHNCCNCSTNCISWEVVNIFYFVGFVLFCLETLVSIWAIVKHPRPSRQLSLRKPSLRQPRACKITLFKILSSLMPRNTILQGPVPKAWNNGRRGRLHRSVSGILGQ